MRIIVLGAGVVGVTTAYYLSGRGARVTLVDRADTVASATSFANAGQLSWSYPDSLANPELLARLPRLLTGRDPESRIRLSPALIAWGLRLLTHCLPRRSRRNTLALLHMAMRSAQLLQQLRRATQIEFEHRAAGKMVLLHSRRERDNAARMTALKQQHGSDIELLSAGEARRIEPALDGFDSEFIAALYAPGDEVGDARRFSAELAAWLTRHTDVDLRLNSPVERLLYDGRRVVGVDAGTPLEADAVVVCLGVWTPALVADVGVRAAIQPMRGYSITLPARQAPRATITSPAQRVTLTRLGDRLRIAGFADFVGFTRDGDAERVAALLRGAQRLAPAAADYSVGAASPWGGFRPMTPSGRPRVGATRRPGLYLNAGHGMLGWTLACATAEAVTDNVIRDLSA